MRSSSLERFIVVIWWQIALLSLFNPAVPEGRATTVGPRRAWVGEVDTGITIMERHAGVSLKASWERMMTGRLPVCSAPERGARFAQ